MFGIDRNMSLHTTLECLVPKIPIYTLNQPMINICLYLYLETLGVLRDVKTYLDHYFLQNYAIDAKDYATIGGAMAPRLVEKARLQD